MQVTIQNSTHLPNRLNNLLEGKIVQLGNKFRDLKGAEVQLYTEGTSPQIFVSTLRLKTNRQYIILKKSDQDIAILVYELLRNAHRCLSERN